MTHLKIDNEARHTTYDRACFKVLMYVLGRNEKNSEMLQSEYVARPSEFEAGI
jgi:hypothetical protein